MRLGWKTKREMADARVESLKEENDGVLPEVASNRDYRRDVARSQRLRGAGFTRPIRKGREKRGS